MGGDQEGAGPGDRADASAESRDGYPEAAPDGAPLRVVLKHLGAGVEVVGGWECLDAPPHDVLLLDVTALDEARGCIVLAIGVDTSAPAWPALLQDLARAGAAAVLVKASAGPGLVPAGQHSAVAVVAVDPALSWDHLYALLRAVLVSARSGSPAASRSSLRGVHVGDLFSLANTIAAACGGAVAIEDTERRVLAYSALPGHEVDETRRQGILGRRVPADPGHDDLYRRLVRQPGVLRDQSDPEFPRLAVPVTLSGENLGSIWLIARGTEVSGDADRILMDVAPVAAMHLLRARAEQELDRDLREHLVASLFDRRLSASHVARRLGLPLGVACGVIAFGLGPLVSERGSNDGERKLTHLANVVALRLQGFRQGAVTAAYCGAVYALVPMCTGDKSLLAAPVDRIVRDARQALRVPVRAAIGPVALRWDDVPLARQQAARLLALLDSSPEDPHVGDVERMRYQVVLAELAALVAKHPWLPTGGVVAKMATADASGNTGYVATIASYLQSFGDCVTAARRLNIHPNTLRYRLRRIEQIFSVDLQDHDTRLVLALESRLLQQEQRAAGG